MAFEVPTNAAVLSNTIREHRNVITLGMDALDYSVESFIAGKFTTVTCLIGTEDVTRHAVRSYLASPFCFELAYLLPSRVSVARGVWERLEKAECLLEKIEVSFAGSGGRKRTVVVSCKRQHII